MKSQYSGYMGKVMMVDLTTEMVSEHSWSDEQREEYLGGKIMAARILCDYLTGKEAAFSEENWVGISTGTLTGTGASSSARIYISAPSRQTGILTSSNCGGASLPPEKGRLCIGPAGENLIKYAGIISDERAAGPTGLGAVLGWKGSKTVMGDKTQSAISYFPPIS